MKLINNCYSRIIADKNIWNAWLKFRRGKRKRLDIIKFEANLEENLLLLRNDLRKGVYRHGEYYQFTVRDPKMRLISVPSVRDRIVHQAVCNILMPFYETVWSPYSFSCRLDLGTLAALEKIAKKIRSVSQNGKKECWILHGDIKKCFDSISHKQLQKILEKRIRCRRTLDLLAEIIGSFKSNTKSDNNLDRGLPLGNLTSQWLVNVYLDVLDGFIVQGLDINNYVRYADDFILILSSRQDCLYISCVIKYFLQKELNLAYPKDHEKIKKLLSGSEVLGSVYSPGYRIVKALTARRMSVNARNKTELYKNGHISSSALESMWQSYRGMLQYGYNHKKILMLRDTITTYGESF